MCMATSKKIELRGVARAFVQISAKKWPVDPTSLATPVSEREKKKQTKIDRGGQRQRTRGASIGGIARMVRKGRRRGMERRRRNEETKEKRREKRNQNEVESRITEKRNAAHNNQERGSFTEKEKEKGRQERERERIRI